MQNKNESYRFICIVIKIRFELGENTAHVHNSHEKCAKAINTFALLIGILTDRFTSLQPHCDSVDSVVLTVSHHPRVLRSRVSFAASYRGPLSKSLRLRVFAKNRTRASSSKKRTVRGRDNGLSHDEGGNRLLFRGSRTSSESRLAARTYCFSYRVPDGRSRGVNNTVTTRNTSVGRYVRIRISIRFVAGRKFALSVTST